MNKQHDELNLNAEINDSETSAEPFADLPVEDDEQLKGGPGGGYGNGGVLLNHNETTADDDEAEPEPLTDLEVEDDEQLKGGPGGWGYGGSGVLLNHNETTADDDEDNDAKTARLADLAVSEERGDGIKGGWGNGKTYIDLNGNGLLLPAVQKVREAA